MLFRVEPSRAQDVGINHAAAQKLNEACLLANTATASSAEHAGDVQLRTRFRKRKEAGSEARLNAVAKESPHKVLQRSLQVRQSDVLVNAEHFQLLEHRTVRRIGRIVAINLAVNDVTHRRRRLFHDADLVRRGVRAQQHLVLDEQGVHLVDCRMISGEVQRLEVVEKGLDLGSFRN